MNALVLLKDEMRTDQIENQVNAIHRLKTVMLSIDANQTSTELVPFLKTLID